MCLVPLKPGLCIIAAGAILMSQRRPNMTSGRLKLKRTDTTGPTDSLNGLGYGMAAL